MSNLLSFRSRDFLKVFLCLVSLYVVITYFYRNKSNFVVLSAGKLPQPGSTKLSTYLDTYAKKVKGTDGKERKLIILAMTDASFVEMALNMYESSFRRFSIDNYLFIGTGSTSCNLLLQKNVHCFYYTDDPSSNVSDSYGSKSFIRKMNIRTNMILESIAAGFTIVHTDLDVVFINDPMPTIEALIEKHDLMIMWDYSAYNAGFLVINPTTFTGNVYLNLQSRTNSSASLDDQKALNQALGDYSRENSVTFRQRVHKLDVKKFMCGKSYFEDGHRNFPPSDPQVDNCAGCLVVHNNWIVSKEAKIYRFKEALLWWVDEEGYYSDVSRKYLTFSNPSIPKLAGVLKTEKYEVEALKTAFALSRMLNRTLVLPRFHCVSRECSLISYLSVRHLDKHFFKMYRENSFFRNPLIPEELKSLAPFYSSQYSLDSPKVPRHFLFLTKVNKPYTEIVNKTTVFDLSNADTIQEDFIREKLRVVEDQVIHFTSLIGVSVAFKDQATKNDFETSINLGFVKKSYMQFK